MIGDLGGNHANLASDPICIALRKRRGAAAPRPVLRLEIEEVLRSAWRCACIAGPSRSLSGIAFRGCRRVRRAEFGTCLGALFAHSLSQDSTSEATPQSRASTIARNTKPTTTEHSVSCIAQHSRMCSVCSRVLQLLLGITLEVSDDLAASSVILGIGGIQNTQNGCSRLVLRSEYFIERPEDSCNGTSNSQQCTSRNQREMS